MTATSDRAKPSMWDYMPPSYHRQDPIERLPGADELQAELTEAIEARLKRGERHTHTKRDGCLACAAEAAETVVRYLERNTRVIASEALAPEEHQRANAAIRSMPYLGSSRGTLRLKGDLAIHPTHPTVGDLLADLETIRDRLLAVMEHDNDRDRELRVYRRWREAVQALATEVVDTFDKLDSATVVEVQPSADADNEPGGSASVPPSAAEEAT